MRIASRASIASLSYRNTLVYPMAILWLVQYCVRSPVRAEDPATGLLHGSRLTCNVRQSCSPMHPPVSWEHVVAVSMSDAAPPTFSFAVTGRISNNLDDHHPLHGRKRFGKCACHTGPMPLLLVSVNENVGPQQSSELSAPNPTTGPPKDGHDAIVLVLFHSVRSSHCVLVIVQTALSDFTSRISVERCEHNSASEGKR